MIAAAETPDRLVLATHDSTGAAPGSLVAVTGDWDLQGARLSVGNLPATPVSFQGSTLFRLPERLSEGLQEWRLTLPDGREAGGETAVAPTAPGIFLTSARRGAVVHAATAAGEPFDVTDSTREDGRTRLIISATGLNLGGGPDRRIEAYAVVPGADHTPLTIERILSSDEVPGLDLVTIVLPDSLEGGGELELQISADGMESNRVPIVVRSRTGPVIQRLSQTQAVPYSEVAVYGESFGVRNRITLERNGSAVAEAPAVSVSATELRFAVPKETAAGQPLRGQFEVCVHADERRACSSIALAIADTPKPARRTGELALRYLGILDAESATSPAETELDKAFQDAIRRQRDSFRSLIEAVMQGESPMAPVFGVEGQTERPLTEKDIAEFEEFLANSGLVDQISTKSADRAAYVLNINTSTEQGMIAIAGAYNRRANLQTALSQTQKNAFAKAIFCASNLTFGPTFSTVFTVATTLNNVEMLQLALSRIWLSKLTLTPSAIELSPASAKSFFVAGDFTRHPRLSQFVATPARALLKEFFKEQIKLALNGLSVSCAQTLVKIEASAKGLPDPSGHLDKILDQITNYVISTDGRLLRLIDQLNAEGNTPKRLQLSPRSVKVWNASREVAVDFSTPGNTIGVVRSLGPEAKRTVRFAPTLQPRPWYSFSGVDGLLVPEGFQDALLSVNIVNPNRLLPPVARVDASFDSTRLQDNQRTVVYLPAGGQLYVKLSADRSTGGGSNAIRKISWRRDGIRGPESLGEGSTIYRYFPLGYHRITVTVENSFGLTSSVPVTIDLRQRATPPSASVQMSSQGSWAGNNGTLNLTVAANASALVSFSAASSSAGTGAISSYEWRSNGTVISTQPSFNYSFGTPSNSIRLKVTNSGGLTAMAYAQVNVAIARPPAAVIRMSAQNRTAGNQQTLTVIAPRGGSAVVAFDAAASTGGQGSIASYEWRSNGTVISRQQSFSFAFGTPSNTITLKVVNSRGESSAAQAQLNVRIQ